MNEKDNVPERIWAVIGEIGGIWSAFDTPEKATAYPGPRMMECASREVVEYARVHSPTGKVSEGDGALAQAIVREWAEHDMNEHHGSDYLRDEFGSDHMEERIQAALATVRKEAISTARAACAQAVKTFADEFHPSRDDDSDPYEVLQEAAEMLESLEIEAAANSEAKGGDDG